MTKKTTLSLLLIFFLLVLVVLALVRDIRQRNSYNQASPEEVKIEETQKKELWIGQNKIMAEIADDAQERAEGLSGRDSLGEEEGMFFIFNEPDFYSFWMKDMKFALDFIWILDDEIVDITENVPPPENIFSDLPIYQPRQAINKVLEVNAGWAESHGAEIGDKVEIKD